MADFYWLNDMAVGRSECSRNLLQGSQADVAQGTVWCMC